MYIWAFKVHFPVLYSTSTKFSITAPAYNIYYNIILLKTSKDKLCYQIHITMHTQNNIFPSQLLIEALEYQVLLRQLLRYPKVQCSQDNNNIIIIVCVIQWIHCVN